MNTKIQGEFQICVSVPLIDERQSFFKRYNRPGSYGARSITSIQQNDLCISPTEIMKPSL